MGSLANCIKIHGISKTEAALLQKKAMEYRKGGMKAKLANEQAVSDMLTDLTAEKDSIDKQIQAVLARRQPEKAGLRQKVKGLIDTGQITKEELDTHVRDKTILQRLGVATEGEGRGRVEDIAPVGKKAVHGQVEGEEVKPKEAWKMTLQEYESVYGKPRKGATSYTENTFHKNSVLTALNQGKPVPAEVLKDYPDLQKPTGEAGFKISESTEPSTGFLIRNHLIPITLEEANKLSLLNVDMGSK